MMRRERPTTDAPFFATCSVRRAARHAVCRLPMRLAVRRAAATLRVSSFAACRALALVFAARFAMPRGVGVRPRRGSCRGRHPVRCRMLLGAAGIRPQRRALRLCVCLRLRHAVRLHSCSQPGLRCPAVWACGREEARAEVGILSAAGCCSVRRGYGRRGVRCDFACVFVCGMPCACTRVRSPVCDAPRCGRAAAKRLVPRSASCSLPGCCSVRRGCGRRGGIRRLRSAPRNSIRASRRRGCRPRKRRRGRRRRAVQRS